MAPKKLKKDIFARRLDSNAHAIIGSFRHQAKIEGWTDDEIREVIDEAKQGDFDHLLRTLMGRIE